MDLLSYEIFLNYEIFIIKMTTSQDKKILEAFNKSLNNYEDFQKSIHWKNILDHKIKKFNLENLPNFKNNGLCDDFNNARLMYKKRVIQNFEKFRNKYDFENFKKYLFKKDLVGNLKSEYYIDIDGYHIDGYILTLLFLLANIEKFIFNEKRINIVCEIGGGDGTLSSMLMKNMNNTKYIHIELPETSFVCSYYLANKFPQKKFLFYSDLKKNELSISDIHEYDFIIVPPWVKFNDDLKVDLFINCSSMMEMTSDIIKTYFSLIQNNINLNGLFINSNRYYKDTVNEKIMISKFPYDMFWKKIYSNPHDYFPKIHILISERADEFNNEFVKELENIYELGKKYMPRDLPLIFVRLIRFIKNFFGTLKNPTLNTAPRFYFYLRQFIKEKFKI